ncbi:hypothetical protein MTO96_007848 [Rhipicephalus appendiculatus]
MRARNRDARVSCIRLVGLFRKVPVLSNVRLLPAGQLARTSNNKKEGRRGGNVKGKWRGRADTHADPSQPAQALFLIGSAGMTSSGFCCLLCGKQFNGPTPYLAHQQSDKHRKKAKAHALLTSALAGDGVSTGTGNAGALVEEENTVPSPAVPPMKRKVSHPIICTVCNVSLNSRITMETHIQCRRQLMNAVENESSGAGSHSGRSDAMTQTAAATAPEKPQPWVSVWGRGHVLRALRHRAVQKRG